MAKETPAADPLEFVRGMWSNMGFSLPGMVTPTLDVNELEKRIADLRAVENWLKMNLNMLQMTTQGLEMQRVALVAVQAMGQQAREAREARQAGQAAGQASGQTPAHAPVEAPATPGAGANPSPGPNEAAAQMAADASNLFAAAASMWPWNLMTPPPAKQEASAPQETKPVPKAAPENGARKTPAEKK